MDSRIVTHIAKYIIFVTQFINVNDEKSYTSSDDATPEMYSNLNHLFFKSLRDINREQPIKENYVDLEKIYFGITIRNKKSPKNIDDLAILRLSHLFNDNIVVSNDQYSKRQDYNMCEVRILLFKDYMIENNLNNIRINSSSHIYPNNLNNNMDITFVDETSKNTIVKHPQTQLGFKLNLEKRCSVCHRKKNLCRRKCKSKKTYLKVTDDSLVLV
jgi:hypothetical protein